MLELKNVCKTYKSKNTSDTEALKNLNLNFNSVGLSFILGKSGCGKSTLLNILGGLDTPTSGEIIFKGKSFKDFKGKDYDSYRNTSVGFVFQEYNLVEKFNVFDNVAYSLKLQDSKIDENIVLDVLDKVGLKDLAKRKVNELSGGQKQRVAIARALVKNPSIILADEPTGNLDSESSKMIFEILKKLSQERLVIVVSHDAESANTFGDRIISLQDGVVISDTNPQVLDNNIDYILKKNHLPFKEAFRFSIKNIFGHKVKLILSIILIAFALSFFGFTIMQNYLKSKSEIERISKEFDVKYIDIIKLDKKEEFGVCPLKGYYRNCYMEGFFTKEEIDSLTSKNNIKLNTRYIFQVRDARLNLLDLDEQEHNRLGYYYYNYHYAQSFTELKKDEFNFKLIGSIPEEFNEVVIIKPVADYIINYGAYLYDSEEVYKPSSYQELISDKKEIKFGNTYVVISGIIDDNLEEFESLKTITDNELRQDNISLENKKLIEKYNYKYPVHFYTLEGFKDKMELKENDTRFFRFSESDESIQNIKLFESMNVYTIDGLIQMDELTENGIIVNTKYLDKISNGEFTKNMNTYIIENKDLNPDKTSEEYREEFVVNYINVYGIQNKMVSLSLIKIYENDDNYKPETLHLRIAGVSLESDDYYTTSNILNKDSDEKYRIEAYVLTSDIDNYNEFLNDYPIDGEKYLSSNSFIINISEHEYSMKIISKYVFIISLIFTLFAILLLFNFIGLSINDNKKEIGVLRALGTGKKDVSKIYSIQGLLIGIISYVLSIFLLGLYAKGENNILLGGEMKKVFDLELFGISFMPLMIMFIFVVVVIILSVISVSLRITKMKPIDAINNK